MKRGKKRLRKEIGSVGKKFTRFKIKVFFCLLHANQSVKQHLEEMLSKGQDNIVNFAAWGVVVSNLVRISAGGEGSGKKDVYVQ